MIANWLVIEMMRLSGHDCQSQAVEVEAATSRFPSQKKTSSDEYLNWKYRVFNGCGTDCKYLFHI